MPGLFRSAAGIIFVLVPGAGFGPLLSQAQTMGHSHASGAIDHSAHARTMQATAQYVVSRESYNIPKVNVTNQSGKPVALQGLLQSPEPVALNFIFTTCTTICPVMTATFSKMSKELGDEGRDLRMISISIDPEYDSPAALSEYAEKFHAGAKWQFLTGSLDDIVHIQKAFRAYAGDKMNHRPITFLRAPGASEWVRIEGLAGGSELAGEYRKLVPQQASAEHHH